MAFWIKMPKIRASIKARYKWLKAVLLLEIKKLDLPIVLFLDRF